MIDLCKLFGVKEGEEFKIEYVNGSDTRIFKIEDGYMCDKSNEKDGYATSTMPIYMVKEIKKIIKLPMKIEFTNDELCILRNINKKYKWITRTESNMLYVHINKPIKSYDLSCGYWVDDSIYDSAMIGIYNHLFNCIQWDNKEPVFIDDYVER